MRWSLLATCLTLLPLSDSLCAADLDSRQFGWHADYSAAKAEAKRAGKPLFVVFRCER